MSEPVPDARIRAAVPDDFPRLLTLWRAAVEATHAFLAADDVDAIEADVRTYLPQMRDLRVAEDASVTVVGFVAQDDGEVHMLFVDPAAHGRGFGSALLAAATAGFTRTTVDVNEQNPSGRRFYEARGYRQAGRSETDGEGRPFPILHLERP